MKFYHALVLFSFLIVFSCSDNSTEKTSNQASGNETPEALNKNAFEQDISSISKRYRSDIISELYNEALENNPELKELNTRINRMGVVKNDSLKLYAKYANTNKNYWIAVNNYINQLNDSILKESVTEAFTEFENNYTLKVAEHESSLDTINKKSISLNDRLLLMKLMITAPMMMNYQKNELPDIESLKKLIKEYEKLIKETKQYTEMKK